VTQRYSSAARLKLGRASRPGGLNCRERLTNDFEDTVAKYRIFQAQEVNTSLARKNGRGWRFKLELEAPEANMLEVLKTIDSGIEVGINSETEDYEFAF
jgi:hypothetical protein